MAGAYGDVTSKLETSRYDIEGGSHFLADHVSEPIPADGYSMSSFGSRQRTHTGGSSGSNAAPAASLHGAAYRCESPTQGPSWGMGGYEDGREYSDEKPRQKESPPQCVKVPLLMCSFSPGVSAEQMSHKAPQSSPVDNKPRGDAHEPLRPTPAQLRAKEVHQVRVSSESDAAIPFSVLRQSDARSSPSPPERTPLGAAPAILERAPISAAKHMPLQPNASRPLPEDALSNNASSAAAAVHKASPAEAMRAAAMRALAQQPSSPASSRGSSQSAPFQRCMSTQCLTADQQQAYQELEQVELLGHIRQLEVTLEEERQEKKLLRDTFASELMAQQDAHMHEVKVLEDLVAKLSEEKRHLSDMLGQLSVSGSIDLGDKRCDATQFHSVAYQSHAAPRDTGPPSVTSPSIASVSTSASEREHLKNAQEARKQSQLGMVVADVLARPPTPPYTRVD